MKKLKKLKLENLDQVQFDSLTSMQMAKLTGGTTYASCNTVTVGNKGGGGDDGRDAID